MVNKFDVIGIKKPSKNSISIGKRRIGYWEIAKNGKVIYEGFKSKTKAISFAKQKKLL